MWPPTEKCMNTMKRFWMMWHTCCYSFTDEIFVINTLHMKNYITAVNPVGKWITDGGSMVEWLTRRTSNLRIASCIGSDPVRDNLLFPCARNLHLTPIFPYWLFPGTGLFQECLYKLTAYSFLHNRI